MISLLILPLASLADMGIDDAEDSAVAALDGQNGGAGFNAWGSGALVCEADFFVVDGSVMTDVNSFRLNIDTDADDKCERELTSYIVASETFSFDVRQTVTTNRFYVSVGQDTSATGNNEPGIQIVLGSSGQIQAIDNLTVRNLQAYSANVTYTIQVVPNVPAETYSVKINGADGAFCTVASPCQFNSAGTVTYTALKYLMFQDGADVAAGSGYVDEISDLVEGGGGGGTPATTTTLGFDEQPYSPYVLMTLFAFVIIFFVSIGRFGKFVSVKLINSRYVKYNLFRIR